MDPDPNLNFRGEGVLTVLTNVSSQMLVGNNNSNKLIMFIYRTQGTQTFIWNEGTWQVTSTPVQEPQSQSLHGIRHEHHEEVGTSKEYILSHRRGDQALNKWIAVRIDLFGI